jgi:hypothetical protein
MKIKLVIILFLVISFGFGSCLKDTPYLDVSNSAPIIEFGLSPANGDFGPFNYAGDTTGSPDIDTAVAVDIASPQVLGKDVTVSVAIDSSQIPVFDTANHASFTMLPAGLYSLDSTTITIKAGYRVGRVPVTLHLSSFPASHSFALPLVITAGEGLIISGNSSTFMWLFQR